MVAPTRIPDTVTICITSCGRLDLLAETLRTFRQFNTGGRYILSEDSGDEAVFAQCRAIYPEARLITSTGRTGLMNSIDRAYSAAETPYIFHLEDDWSFDGPIDWTAAIALLEADPRIAHVCVRAFEEIKEKHRAKSDPRTHAGADFRIMQRDAHPEYYAWSSNPGLIAKSTYLRFAPFGRVIHDRMSGIIKEAGLTQAWLLPGVARHIGQDRTVHDPMFPAKPKSRPEKWLRALKKKLYYAGLRKEPF